MSTLSPTQASALFKVGKFLRSCDPFVLFDIFILLLVVGLTAGLGSSGSISPNIRTSIVLGQRIGPVRYGEPQAQVMRTLGPGLDVVFGPQEQGLRSYPYGLYVAYPPIWVGDETVSVGVEPKTAAIIMTRSPAYKTRSGLDVGSSLRQIQQQVPQVDCPIATGMSTPTKCEHADATANTVFTIDPTTSRVSQVEIAPNRRPMRITRPSQCSAMSPEALSR